MFVFPALVGGAATPRPPAPVAAARFCGGVAPAPGNALPVPGPRPSGPDGHDHDAVARCEAEAAAVAKRSKVRYCTRLARSCFGTSSRIFPQPVRSNGTINSNFTRQVRQAGAKQQASSSVRSFDPSPDPEPVHSKACRERHRMHTCELALVAPQIPDMYTLAL